MATTALKGTPIQTNGDLPAVGSDAPDFLLVATDMSEKTLASFAGKKKIVGKLFDLKEYQKIFKLDDWNEVVIIAKGPHIRHYTNGRLIMDCVDEHPERSRKEGVLAFQLHAGKPMWAEFKDIRIKELK